MKRNLCILIFLLFFTIVTMLYFTKLKPEKIAIKLDEIPKTEYIIIETVYSTVSDWTIIGDQNGNYDIPVDVTLVGNEPRLIYDIQTGGNKFVCYGKYLDDIMNLAGYKNKVFNVKEWDVVHPVKHNSIYSFLLSKKYLYKFELLPSGLK